MADKVTASSIAASLTIGEIFAAEKHFGGKCLRRSKNDRREPMSPLEATVSMAWVAERVTPIRARARARRAVARVRVVG